MPRECEVNDHNGDYLVFLTLDDTVPEILYGRVCAALQQAYNRGRADQHEVDFSFALAALEGQRPTTR